MKSEMFLEIIGRVTILIFNVPYLRVGGIFELGNKCFLLNAGDLVCDKQSDSVFL
jgi:hypothetical protein